MKKRVEIVIAKCIEAEIITLGYKLSKVFFIYRIKKIYIFLAKYNYYKINIKDCLFLNVKLSRIMKNTKFSTFQIEISS